MPCGSLRGSLRAAGIAGALALPFLLPGHAAADVTDDLLRQLFAKGILTQEEYNTLTERRSAERQREAEAVRQALPAVSPAQAIDPDTVVRKSDSGVGFTVGDVSVVFSGSINGYYTQEWTDDDGATVVGGLAGVADSAAVRNGLLPGFLKVDVTANQGGWDVGAHFGIYPGINSVSWEGGGANSPGNPVALATSGIDFRQTYLTFARPEFGEVKIGRDIGLFGSEAILTDITLLSVGSPGNNPAPSNTSLGRIGLGYIYPDFQPQITYTSPSAYGFQVAVGVFQPLVTAGQDEVNDEPGFQAEVTYDMPEGMVGDFSGRLWASVITQDHEGLAGSPSYRGNGYDLGAKLGWGPATVAGYYYWGDGIGTTGLFILATDAAGNERDSDGFYVQGAVEVIPKVTLAASYGESNLDLAPGEVNPTLVKSNTSWVGQVRYGLTDWVTLIGEYISTESEAHDGNEISSDTMALGAILFF